MKLAIIIEDSIIPVPSSSYVLTEIILNNWAPTNPNTIVAVDYIGFIANVLLVVAYGSP